MKYILHSIIALFAISVISCSDFLDADNPSGITEDFYDTKKGQEQLVVSIYNRYREVFKTAELQYYGTDLYMAITESPNERMFNGYDKTFNSTASVVPNYWERLYKIVQEANVLLNRCKVGNDGVTQKDYETLTSQAKFFRSLAYYYLVETFGDVPLLVDENKGVILTVTRESESKIYDFIIADMESILGKLPHASGQKGKLTDNAVKHLLAKLYLTRAYKDYAANDDFQKAAGLFGQIINDTQKTNILLDNYSDVFDENKQDNLEIIWAIQYGEDKNYIGEGNSQQSMFGFNIVALYPNWYDKVQSDYSSMQRGYWINPRVHELFSDPVLDSRYDVTFQREFKINNADKSPDLVGQFGIYFPRWNDNSGNTVGALKYVPFKVDGEYNWYPSSTALPVLEKGSDLMPIISKFKDTKIQWGGKGSREDVIFRMGDTYLLCAEALLGANDAPAALALVNDVRMRAASDPARVDEMKLTTVNIDVILDERARELLGEHDRWFDLKRTGKLLERAKAYNIFVQKYDNINSNHLVRPIPQDERNKVEGLTQNAGY